jgi:ribosome-binding protein aMBF1 (putative translation factor)
MDHTIEIKIDGREYVAVPRAEYERLTGTTTTSPAPEGSVEAIGFARASLGAKLRKAREGAGLTQAQLAKKLRKTQPLVSGAESGSVRVGERYVAAVLKACRLPPDWSGK